MASMLSRAQIREAQRLRDDGWKWSALGARFKCSPETVHRAVDPSFADRMRDKAVRHRMRDKNGTERNGLPRADYASTRADAAARMAEIPADTRTLTARMFGDPLPGRSALARKQVEARA